jgi:N-methylhydantoinase B/oxoprolinase/acetone carboxylase alpha subunit
MDDGSPIQLRITIDAELGSAIFDFEGGFFFWPL